MAGPWEKYGQKTGPWAKYAKAQPAADTESDVSREARETLSRYTQHPAQGAYEQSSTLDQIGQAADDVMRLTADGMSFGYADKLAAGGDPKELELERAKTGAARDRAGWAGTAAEVVGSAAVPVGLAGKGLTLAKPAMGAVKRPLALAAEGMGYGGLNAAGHDEDLATGAITGGVAGGLGSVAGDLISGGVSKVAGAFNKALPKITVDELKSAGTAAYKRADQAGVIINKQGLNKLARDLVDDATEHGFRRKNEPGAAEVLDALREQLHQPMTLKGLDTLRKQASNAYDPMNRSNNKLVGQFIGRIDDLIEKADPNYFSGVDTKGGTEALKEARKYWGRARKLETVEKFRSDGETIGNSQINQDVEGATRRKTRQLLTSDAKARGFSKDELEAAKKASSMTTGTRALRAASGLFPQGKLSGMAQGAQALYTVPSLLAGNPFPLMSQIGGMGVGYAAKKGEEKISQKAMNEFVDLVARGGKAPVTKNAVQRLAQSKRDAIARMLLGIGVSASQ